MGEQSHIAWTDDTYNPWRGCTKVSDGCKNCYAETLVTRKMGGEWGKGAARVRSKTTFNDPLKWNKKPLVCPTCNTVIDGDCRDGCFGAGMDGYGARRRRVFSLSLGDWWDEEVPATLRGDALRVIWQTPNLDHLMLTKRPQNFMALTSDVVDRFTVEPDWTGEFIDWIQAWQDGKPPVNVWFGVSVENQATADERIPKLLEIPAKVRFLSCEPLLTSVYLYTGSTMGRNYIREGSTMPHDTGIQWVIVGGESGADRRNFDGYLEHLYYVVDQCRTAGVPVFVKQDCAFKPGQQGRIPDDVWALKQFPTVNR